MAEILEIDDLETLKGYRLAWNSLAGHSPAAPVSLTFDGFLAAWHSAVGEKELYVLVVQVLGRTVGILPLAISRPISWCGSVRVLSQAVESQRRGSVIGSDRTATYMTAMRFLAEHRSEWDQLDLCLTDASEMARCRSAMQWASIKHVQSRETGDQAAWRLRGISRSLPGRIMNRCWRMSCRCDG